MKRSEVIEELLNSYYFQHGKRTNRKLVDKARRLISIYQREEAKLKQNNESEEK